MKRGVLLDRDGTIIEEAGYLDRLESIAPFAWTAEAIRMLADAGLIVAVVTNQAGVAQGYFDEAFVRETHRRLDDLLHAQGAAVDRYYYCPHHPDAVVDRYRQACRCRKPAPGLAETAAKELKLDLSRSFVVGDRWRDVALAHAVGARGVLVRTGYGLIEERALPERAQPEIVVDTLLDAARWIVEQVAGDGTGARPEAEPRQ